MSTWNGQEAKRHKSLVAQTFGHEPFDEISPNSLHDAFSQQASGVFDSCIVSWEAAKDACSWICMSTWKSAKKKKSAKLDMKTFDWKPVACILANDMLSRDKQINLNIWHVCTLSMSMYKGTQIRGNNFYEKKPCMHVCLKTPAVCIVSIYLF